MDWTPVFTFLMTLCPWVQYVLMGLGSLVIIGTAIDTVRVKLNFMDKILAIPILGDFLKAVAKLSPFNVREKP